MTNLEKELVPIELASELQEIGFNEFCMFYYEHNKLMPIFGIESRDIKNKTHFNIIKINAYNILQSKNSKTNIVAPSYEQIFSWFRSNGLFHSITIEEDLIENNILFKSEIRNTNADIVSMFTRDTYEEARKDLLKRLIKIYKDGKTNV